MTDVERALLVREAFMREGAQPLQHSDARLTVVLRATAYSVYIPLKGGD